MRASQLFYADGVRMNFRLLEQGIDYDERERIKDVIERARTLIRRLFHCPAMLCAP